MQKSKKTIVRKETSYTVSTFLYLESEEPDAHRSLRMNGVSRHCDYAMLQEQEYGEYDDEA